VVVVVEVATLAVIALEISGSSRVIIVVDKCSQRL
jgi:hypothetical protein